MMPKRHPPGSARLRFDDPTGDDRHFPNAAARSESHGPFRAWPATLTVGAPRPGGSRFATLGGRRVLASAR
jgi:hypothetical protein